MWIRGASQRLISRSPAVIKSPPSRRPPAPPRPLRRLIRLCKNAVSRPMRLRVCWRAGAPRRASADVGGRRGSERRGGEPVGVRNYFTLSKRREDKHQRGRRGFLAAGADGNAVVCVRKRKPIKSSGKWSQNGKAAAMFAGTHTWLCEGRDNYANRRASF